MTNKNLKIKRKFLLILIAVYLSFVLVISIVPHLAEQSSRGKLSDGVYESHLVFPKDGVYGHYTSVVLFDKSLPGRIDLKYIFDSNTLFIERSENIKELTIDCRLMYENKCQEVFEKDPKDLGTDYYKTYFKETNHGLFTVIVNSDTPMEKLQFLDTPLPISVLVNNKEWWDTETSYYTATGNDVTVTHIPEGTTNVKIYFQELKGKRPHGAFSASKYIAFLGEEITFDASGSYDSDGEISHYIWNFGDGSELSGKIIKHSYSEVGNYTVMLTVRDNDYLEDVTQKTIYIISSTEDSDFDGVPNIIDPDPESNVDSDTDGLSDDFEDVISGTDKTKKDTDNDGVDDKTEWDKGTDPNDPLNPLPVGKKEKEKADYSVLWVVLGLVIIIIIIIIINSIINKKRKGKGESGDINSNEVAIKMKPRIK